MAQRDRARYAGGLLEISDSRADRHAIGRKMLRRDDARVRQQRRQLIRDMGRRALAKQRAELGGVARRQEYVVRVFHGSSNPAMQESATRGVARRCGYGF